jgi:hypothetical protein
MSGAPKGGKDHALQGCGGLLLIEIDVRHAAVFPFVLWPASPESKSAPVFGSLTQQTPQYSNCIGAHGLLRLPGNGEERAWKFRPLAILV